MSPANQTIANDQFRMPPKQWKRWCQLAQSFFKSSLVGAVVVTLAVFAGVNCCLNNITSEVQTFSRAVKNEKDVAFSLKTVIKTSIITRSITEESFYVPRQDLETKITWFANAAPQLQYMVLYGPRGSGKSSVVEHAPSNRTGVISIRCLEGSSPFSRLLSASPQRVSRKSRGHSSSTRWLTRETRYHEG
jgi:hypothetical protein